MSLKRTATIDAPHAIFRSIDRTWEFRLLKTYKNPETEIRDPYARWFMAVKSSFTNGQFNIGDTYLIEVTKADVFLASCTAEFREAYQDRDFIRTTIFDESGHVIATSGPLEHG